MNAELAIEKDLKRSASQRTVIADADELEKIFKPEITDGAISDKLKMPVPGDDGIVIRPLYTKTKDGKLGIIDRVQNPKFRNQIAEFMTVEKIENPGVELKMGIGESIKNSFRRMMNDEGWKVIDLPGKPIHLTASYWTTAPMSARDPKIKCKFCEGVGCKECNSSGLQSPTVFNARCRHDLIGNIPAAKKKSEEF